MIVNNEMSEEYHELGESEQPELYPRESWERNSYNAYNNSRTQIVILHKVHATIFHHNSKHFICEMRPGHAAAKHRI